jgi:hypothetical protein
MKNLNLLLLKEMLDYNKETGIFTWKIDRNGAAKKGRKAGCISSDGYIVLSLFNKQYKAHRIAWLFIYGNMPINNIDHINGNKQDNRIDNLRDVTHIENSKNLSIDKRNKSGKTGVGWHSVSKKWIANISVNKKLIHLGYFNNLDDAIKVRTDAEIKYKFHSNHGRDKIIY